MFWKITLLWRLNRLLSPLSCTTGCSRWYCRKVRWYPLFVFWGLWTYHLNLSLIWNLFFSFEIIALRLLVLKTLFILLYVLEFFKFVLILNPRHPVGGASLLSHYSCKATEFFRAASFVPQSACLFCLYLGSRLYLQHALATQICQIFLLVISISLRSYICKHQATLIVLNLISHTLL